LAFGLPSLPERTVFKVGAVKASQHFDIEDGAEKRMLSTDERLIRPRPCGTGADGLL
jgi:hypothetical protein